MTLILRADKGSPLTNNEVDGNFTHLSSIGTVQGTAINTLQSQIANSVVSVNGHIGTVILTASDVGAITSVNGKTGPVVTLGVSDLPLQAPIANPHLTGIPTAPTAAIGTNTTQLATTAFVKQNVHINEDVTFISKGADTGIMIVSGGKAFVGHDKTPRFANGLDNAGNPTGVFGSGIMDHWNQLNFPYGGTIVKCNRINGDISYCLMSDGSLYTWGINLHGSCGAGHNSPIGVPLRVLTDVVDVYDHPSNMEYQHDLGRLFIKRADGFIYATGRNADGQLGLGDTTDRNVFTVIPTFAANTVLGVWNLGTHNGPTIVQKTDNTIWVTGPNADGQLGTGNTTELHSFTNVATNWGVPADGPIVSCHFASTSRLYPNHLGTTEYNSTTGVLRKSTSNVTSLRLCGKNTYGAVGNGNTTQTNTPFLVPSSNDVKQVAIFGGHFNSVHMLRNDGNLYSWGWNGNGNLGNSSYVDVHNTTTLAEASVDKLCSDGMSSYDNGWETQSMIIKTDGQLYFSGFSDITGVGGNGSNTTRSNYTRVRLPTTATITDLGYFSGVYDDPSDYIVVPGDNTKQYGRTFVALTSNNNMYCWGSNQSGQITNVSIIETSINMPVIVAVPRGE